MSACKRTSILSFSIGHHHNACLRGFTYLTAAYNTFACQLAVRSFSSCQEGAVIWPVLLPRCGEKERTAILVTCLAPLLLSRGLLALSISGLPTNALWLATELQPRAAMVSKLNIPGDMVAVYRSVSHNSCPFADLRRQPHLHLR